MTDIFNPFRISYISCNFFYPFRIIKIHDPMASGSLGVASGMASPVPVVLPMAPLTLGVIPDQTAEVAKPFGFDVPESVTDIEGVSLSASLADGTPLPSWLKFDDKQRSFTGTPSHVTELRISLKGTHPASGQSGKTDFLLKVGSGGSKPFIAGQLPAITATAGLLFTDVIPRSAIADPDGDILSFSLSSEDGKLPEWLHFDPNLMIVSGVPDKEQQLQLKVTGRDKDGHSASTPLQLRVKEGVWVADDLKLLALCLVMEFAAQKRNYSNISNMSIMSLMNV